MDWPLDKRIEFTINRNFRRLEGSFRRNPRRARNLLIGTFLLFWLISWTLHHYNSVETRWSRVQANARPGILGAPSDVILTKESDVHVQLCDSKNILCSSWGMNRIWGGEELRMDEAWLVPGSIRVPIGVQAMLTMTDGRRRTIRFGQHQCSRSTLDCQDIKSMIVEASILSAIDGISWACTKEHWKTEPAITHTIRPKRSFPVKDVTMIAQFSISRLDRIEKARVAWAGPVSVAIFLANEADIVQLQKYFERPGKLALYDSVTLTIVKPNYSLDTTSQYPINHLRNIAIQAASTDYIYVIDADFVPTTKLYDFAKSTLVPQLEEATQPVAYVVPCVAIKEEYQGRYPDTIRELQPLIKSGMAYITDPRAGHGPTTMIFLEESVFKNPPAFEVCYESQWEPYYIVNRHAPHPYYDERFRNQGGDKQSHAMLMNAIGFKFLVLREHFMYHMDHSSLKWTGAGLNQKKKDYTYFENYVPEMRKIFGSNFRWPQGCSRPLVQTSKRDLQGIGTM